MGNLTCRPELASGLRRIVVKLGSAALASDGVGLDLSRLAKIASECDSLRRCGIDLILVSSGSILAGRQVLSTNGRDDMALLQACSAVGQPMLMAAYQQSLQQYGICCGQVLLTHDDMGHRQRYLNLRNTLLRLLESGIVPIINENDPVSFEEITVGDNDQLAAMTAEIVGADCLILLTGPDGLYTADPSLPDAKKIDFVAPSDSLREVNTVGKSAAGRGGMRTKLEAARRLTPLGIPVIISSFKPEQAIHQALQGGGTFFQAVPLKSSSQKRRWLLSTAKSNALIRVDAGAHQALLARKSLLASGLIEVRGQFRRGDCIQIAFDHNSFALGLSEYSSRDLQLIKGKKSSEIEAILGQCPSKVVVHSNNLVLKDS